MNMKQRMTLISFLLCAVFLQVLAQKAIQPNLKFGSPTKEEMGISACPYDAGAKAMVLCSITDMHYEYVGNSFRIEYQVKKRIKVLSQEGTDVANISIPYYSVENSGGATERIRSIKAMAYNMENGKLVKTKMGNELVFEERIDKNHMRTKFTVPQVKAGTVFEYQYIKSSDFFYQIDDWYAQEGIPVVYTSYEVEIPEMLIFNFEQSGANNLLVSKVPGSRKYDQLSDHILTNGYKVVGQNLPALKGDKYVWCPEMYASKIGFELRSIEIPGELTKNFTTSWEDIDEMLMNDTDFGGRIKRSNPLKDEMQAARIDTITDFQRKVAATYLLLKKKVRWNGEYALFGNASRNVLKEGKASNADINFLLMNMLNTLNIKTVPMVMSARNQGALPISHPSVEALNTFVVGIWENDTTLHVMDGSSERGYIDVLPPVLLTTAHMVNGGQYNLMANAMARVNTTVKAELKVDGQMEGTIHTRYQNLASLLKKAAFAGAKDSADYVNDIAKQMEISIKSYALDGIRKYSPQADQKLQFEKEVEMGDVIYLNPVLDLPFNEVPFTAAGRTMPVEFDSPMMLSYLAHIKLPAHYALEEMPKPVFVRNEDNSAVFKMQVQDLNGVLVVNYSFSIRKALFVIKEYAGLKTFMEEVYNKTKSVVVLKKVMQ